jgi:lauroyl/myristoyl acyltransferase
LVTSAHLGLVAGVPRALASRGYEVHVPVGDWFFEEATPQTLQQAEWGGIRLVRRGGSYATLARVLGDGGMVFLPFDVPGTRHTHFLGKPAAISSGPAALGFEAGAWVVPIFCRREGARPVLEVDEPIDPSCLEDADALHRSISSVVERAILERPETLARVFAHRLWSERP